MEETKLWRDMTREEKGALLLAHYEGKVIQEDFGSDWIKADPTWRDCLQYCVKPEPLREQVKIYGRGLYWCDAKKRVPQDTHVISFMLVDGEPDLDSLSIEKL